jgi:hypothetical protein
VTDIVELFTDAISSVRTFITQLSGKRSWTAEKKSSWPEGGGRNIVMKEDLGLELGSPQMESLSCLLWTHDLASIENGRITLIGPDFPESMGKSIPFGKVARGRGRVYPRQCLRPAQGPGFSSVQHQPQGIHDEGCIAIHEGVVQDQP